jgi:hypothetical protein
MCHSVTKGRRLLFVKAAGLLHLHSPDLNLELLWLSKPVSFPPQNIWFPESELIKKIGFSLLGSLKSR